MFPREFVEKVETRTKKRYSRTPLYGHTLNMNTSLWRTVFFFPLGKLLHSLKIQPASVIRIPADNEHLFLAQSTNSHRKSASLMKDCIFFYFTNFPGGTSLYKPCRCVPSQRVGFFGLFRFENGYRLCPFWSLNRAKVFEGTMGGYERIMYPFNSKWVRNWRELWSNVRIKKSFCWCSNLMR